MPNIPISAFILAAFLIAFCFAMSRRERSPSRAVIIHPFHEETGDTRYELVENIDDIDQLLDSMDFDFAKVREANPWHSQREQDLMDEVRELDFIGS